jgi:predicted GNAT family acetyltransferase
LKAEYIKIIENNPINKAKLITLRRSENEYEIIEFDIPKEYRDKGIEEQLLKEVTDDADDEGITLHVNINNIMTKTFKY